jgi:hypothetical protein
MWPWEKTAVFRRWLVHRRVSACSVAAVGDLPLTYQWQRNQINLTDGPDVLGATTSSLTLTELTQLSGATYSVIVSNGAGVARAAKSTSGSKRTRIRGIANVF